MFRCQTCNDLGLWLTPQKIIAVCPNLQLKYNDHSPLSTAAEMLRRAGEQMARRGYLIEHINDFRVARMLVRFSTKKPCGRQALIDSCFQWGGSQKLRHLHACIERLRGDWLLPIGSRKGVPHGYWFITDDKDFERWFASYTSAPKRQLSTAHAVAKAFFPAVARQIAFEFEEVAAE